LIAFCLQKIQESKFSCGKVLELLFIVDTEASLLVLLHSWTSLTNRLLVYAWLQDLCYFISFKGTKLKELNSSYRRRWTSSCRLLIASNRVSLLFYIAQYKLSGVFIWQMPHSSQLLVFRHFFGKEWANLTGLHIFWINQVFRLGQCISCAL
jgi:hypothetical protein